MSSRSAIRGSKPDARRLRARVLRWYGGSARELPWRENRDPYRVWISEVMLQQTTVAAVLPYYERFLRSFPSIVSLASASEDDVLALWSGLGYYRRARNLHAAARTIVQAHGGEFPATFEGIAALPGVGTYTAGAIASICFGERRPAVDANVARVLARIFAIAHRAGAGPSRALMETAGRLVPRSNPGAWTQAIMELGARLCKPSKPDCRLCPVAADCLARAAGSPERYGLKKNRPATTRLQASMVVLRASRRSARAGTILLVRRPAGELLGGLYELPGTLASTLSEPSPRDGSKLMELIAPAGVVAGPTAASRDRRVARDWDVARLGRIVHAVTHRSITIDVYSAEAPGPLSAQVTASLGPDRLWVREREIETIPIGAASRKALALAGWPDSVRSEPPRRRAGSKRAS